MMWRLWNFVKIKFKKDTVRRKAFLILNTMLWAGTVFTLAILMELLYQPLGPDIVWNAIPAACYAGSAIGFLGGCIFIMRNTPERNADSDLMHNHM